MAHLIHLQVLLVLALHFSELIRAEASGSGDTSYNTTQPQIFDNTTAITVHAADCPQRGANVSIYSSPTTWNITHSNGKDSWQLQCYRNQSDQVTVNIIAPFLTSSEYPSTETCLQINNSSCGVSLLVKNVTGRSHECGMHKTCCTSSLHCTDRMNISWSSKCNTVFNIQFEDFDCERNVTFRANCDSGTFLKLNREPDSWIKALQQCHKLNSHLVELTSPGVWHDVRSVLKCEEGMENEIWVGLERSIFGTDIDWRWLSRQNNHLNWSSNFPVDKFNNHCGKIVQNQLLDANCHEKLPFICQSWSNSGTVNGQ